MAYGSHDLIKKKIQVLKEKNFILGLFAQRPMVLAKQEAPSVSIVIEVQEATWCLVWDSQGEEGTYQQAGHLYSCSYEAFALFQSDS